MERRVLHTNRIYKSKSHLSQAVRWGDVVWTGGIGPLDESGRVVLGGFEQQVRMCMSNLLTLLEVAGANVDTLLRVNVYLRRIDDFPAFEGVYREYVDGVPPARCLIGCELGHPATKDRPAMDIEVEAVAGVVGAIPR